MIAQAKANVTALVNSTNSTSNSTTKALLSQDYELSSLAEMNEI